MLEWTCAVSRLFLEKRELFCTSSPYSQRREMLSPKGLSCLSGLTSSDWGLDVGVDCNEPHLHFVILWCVTEVGGKERNVESAHTTDFITSGKCYIHRKQNWYISIDLMFYFLCTYVFFFLSGLVYLIYSFCKMLCISGSLIQSSKTG